MKKKSIKIVKSSGVLLIALLLVLMGCAEETFVEPKIYGSLKGTVLRLSDKKPLTNVLVKISPSGKSVIPDAEGKFSVDSLPVGKYSIQTTVEKYKTDLISIDVEEKKTAEVNILLVADNNQNKPPLIPTLVTPGDKAVGVAVSTRLEWQTSDPDKDSLRYSVVLFKEGQNTSTPIATGLHVDSLRVDNLDYATTYYWQVITSDSVNAPVYSKVWSFTTVPAPDHQYFFTRKIAQNYQIFSSNGTETLQLTNYGGNWRPVVSPNRETVAFISNINTDPHIFISNRLGKEMKRVTVVPIGGVSLMDLSFCWSPDGREILYPAYDKLYAVHPDGTGLRIVAQAPWGRFFAGCDWTEQGNRIIARVTGTSQYDNELYIINPGTGVLSPLVTGRPGKMSNPDFSADGKQAVFTLDVANFQNNEGRQLDAHVFLVDVSNGVITDISTEKVKGTNDLDPRFSPNSAQIIFTNTSNDGFSTKSILSMELTGLTRTNILTDAEMVFWR